MALTYEEKLAKLKDNELWLTFTDSQKVFLDAMCKGFKPTRAFLVAYPNTSGTSLLFATRATMRKLGIKKALEIIGFKDTDDSLISKNEAQQLLTKHLRKTNDPTVLVKLLSLYAKIAEWNQEEDDEEEEPDLDKVVAALEKKRRETNGKEKS